MLAELFDSGVFRMIFGFVVGVPLTCIALVAAVHGIFFGISGILEKNLIFLEVGVVTVMGLLGLSGAWYRLFKKRSTMTKNQVKLTRVLLILGLSSSLALFWWALDSKEVVISVLFGLLILVGVAFVVATPRGILTRPRKNADGSAAA